MKKLMAIAFTTAALGLSMQVQAAPQMDKHLEKQLVQVCEALQSNKRLKLFRVMKENNFSYRTIAKGLRCNGVDAVTFALQHDADETANMVAKRANVDLDSMLAKR